MARTQIETLDRHPHEERLEEQFHVREVRAAAAGLAVVAALAVSATPAAAQTPETAQEFWPAANFHAQLGPSLRLLTFGGLKKGEDFPYQQWYVGTGIGYQWRPFSQPHPNNIDPDKEHFLVAGVGYEYLETIQSGSPTKENRIAVQATPRVRPLAGFIVEDRNRVEFRWVNGEYSTRYRNRLTVERDFLLRELRFAPYASAEFFYDPAKHWYEERYSGGLQLPYRRLFMLDLYYLRQNCTTCSPAHLNVVGMTLNFFVGNRN